MPLRNRNCFWPRSLSSFSFSFSFPGVGRSDLLSFICIPRLSSSCYTRRRGRKVGNVPTFALIFGPWQAGGGGEVGWLSPPSLLSFPRSPLPWHLLHSKCRLEQSLRDATAAMRKDCELTDMHPLFYLSQGWGRSGRVRRAVEGGGQTVGNSLFINVKAQRHHKGRPSNELAS